MNEYLGVLGDYYEDQGINAAVLRNLLYVLSLNYGWHILFMLNHGDGNHYGTVVGYGGGMYLYHYPNTLELEHYSNLEENGHGYGWHRPII